MTIQKEINTHMNSLHVFIIVKAVNLLLLKEKELKTILLNLNLLGISTGKV